MLAVEDWAEIRRLRRSEGMPIQVIARTLGVSPQHREAGSGLGRAAEVPACAEGGDRGRGRAQIRELLKMYPTMSATVIAERIGWTRSVPVLSGRVAELRPAYLPPDPASRTSRMSPGRSPNAISGSR